MLRFRGQKTLAVKDAAAVNFIPDPPVRFALTDGACGEQ